MVTRTYQETLTIGSPVVGAVSKEMSMGLADSIMSGTLADGLVNRRASWTGAVVHDLGQPGSVGYGQCFRVAHSRRDPASGDWEMRWSEADYVGTEIPRTEPVYRFDGTTWDMPAYAQTVLPWWAWLNCLLAGGLIAAFLGYCSAPEERGGVILGVFASTLVVAVFCWYIAREPVKGTKVA